MKITVHLWEKKFHHIQLLLAADGYQVVVYNSHDNRPLSSTFDKTTGTLTIEGAREGDKLRVRCSDTESGGGLLLYTKYLACKGGELTVE